MQQRDIELSTPLAMRPTFSKLPQGRNDPCTRWIGDCLWRATRTPEGAATTAIEVVGTRFRMRAWGPGAYWCLDRAAELIGEGQDHFGQFGHEWLDETLRTNPGIRIPKTGAVIEALVWCILGQRVTQMEARRSWRLLVEQLGEAAPAAAGVPELLLPPSPTALSGLPSWLVHRMGVERKRAETIRRIGLCARRLSELPDASTAVAQRKLLAIPGVGEWTAAEVASVALGDIDAVSVGDFHLKNHVGWALAGKPRATDEEMLTLLAPFAPRRGLAVKLILIGHRRPPAYGPRYSPIQIAQL